MKFKRFITFICIVTLLLQGAAFALPAFAQGTNKPYITQYGLYDYIDSNTESPTVSGTVLTTDNTGQNFTPPPWTPLADVPYIFDSDDVIGIRFAVNVATPTYWDENRTRLVMYDAANDPVPIDVLRSGDGTNLDINRNYIFVAPQGRLEPASPYKIIIDAALTSNNSQQAGVQQEIDLTTRSDTTRPTWPAGSSLTVSSIGSSSLTLSWTPAADDVGVANYKILKDGSLYTTVNGTTTICNITGLAAGATYEFKVEAGDAASNWTTDGPAAGATTTTASSPNDVSLSLSTNSTVVRGYITASGTAAPNRWVTIQALDSTPQIVFFDAVKANVNGNYSKTFRVPDTTAGTLTVVAGYGSNVATASLSAMAVTDIASGNVNVETDGSNKNLALTGSSPANISVTIPNRVNDAMISVSDLLITDGSGGFTSSPLPEINITSGVTINNAPVQVEVAIPSGAMASAPEGWDGTINMPAVQPASSVTVTPDPGKTAAVNSVIEVGFGDVPLTFNKAVRILIPGQAGKDVGYYRGGTFTKITNVLSSDSQAIGDALPAGSDGKIDVGSDLVIWTKHFTRFVTYTQTSTEGGYSDGGGTSDSDKQAPTGKDEKSVSPIVQQPAPLLSDISRHWAETGIKELVALGAISGYPDGSFKPDQKITRAEFTSILVLAFKLEPQSGKVFVDTDGHWAQEAIATASSHGIISGYNADTFGPSDPITREQMATMVVKTAALTPVAEALTFTDSDDISGWAGGFMAAAVKSGIMKGYPDNTIRPQGNTTRAEAVTAIVNALHKLSK